MFSLFYSTPSKFAGTITLTKSPSGLGPITDVNGNRWDINGIIGDYVQACPLNELHSYFTDTSGFGTDGMVSQTWKPYKLEIVKEYSNQDK